VTDATATDAGTPEKISSGVSRNPPPTPNRPDRKPTAAPIPTRKNRFIESAAMGK
jgi:hypothetical protein